MVTMKEISIKAGVAQQTVSKILNGRDPDISVTTREKVQAIARDLNYRPNYMASSLKKGRTDTIGFLGEEVALDAKYVMANNMVAAGIESALPDDKTILIFSSNGERGIEKSLALARRGVVDGMVVKVYPFHYRRLEEEIIPVFESIGLPVVVVHPTSQMLPCAHVGVNREQGGYITARRLLDNGITDVKVLMPSAGLSGAPANLEGVVRAFTEQGLPFGPDRIITYGASGGDGNANKLKDVLTGLTQMPRALICHNTMVAENACRRLMEQGLRVPEDVTVTGFGYITPGSDMDGRIQVTGVPLQEQGQAAAGMLLEMLDKKHDAEPGARSRLMVPRILEH